MPKEYKELKELFPRLQGLVDPRVEREIFLTVQRIFNYVNTELSLLENKVNTSKANTEKIISGTSELLNNFATRLVENKGNGNGNNPLQTLGSGTVTSIAATISAVFTVAGSPITESGTLAFTLINQSANRIFAGPTTGAAATPTFRALVRADINFPYELTTSTAADPTTVEYPNNTWGVHKNTVSGDVFVAYNDGGVIKKVLLT